MNEVRGVASLSCLFFFDEKTNPPGRKDLPGTVVRKRLPLSANSLFTCILPSLSFQKNQAEE